MLHSAAYRALDLPWQYSVLDCGVDELPDVLARRPDWAGFSCTMPLKQAALELAVEAAPGARIIGAANTLLPVAGGWRADNTDALGIRGALAEQAVPVSSVTVLGAGGTARAALVALDELGFETCEVVVRDVSRARALLDTAQRLRLGVRVTTFDQLTGELDAPLVISTLPPGAADPLRTAARTVLDVVYADWPTPFAVAASASGARVLSGASMLLHQAAAQVTLMTGRSAPVAAMRSALAAAAPGCGV